MAEIKESTMFVQVYIKIYEKYNFPTQSLHKNKCLAFCPDGFASVNGVCKPCQAPCANCRHEVTRCESCLQTDDNPLKWNFGRSCYEECPIATVADESEMDCKGCISGC